VIRFAMASPNHKTTVILLAVILALALAAAGQAAFAESLRPYAGLEQRPVKALSEQQIGDLLAGRGMGMALAGELNGYPGPAHVLELADALGLDAGQDARVRVVAAAMREEAVPLGERLIAEEAALDRQFAERTVTSASLAAATQAIGDTQARLRVAHLRAHLAMRELLTPEQVRHYAELRGYAATEAGTPAGDAKHDGAGPHHGGR
jgi:Spy/CpxP family protein refolding chaperone